MFTGLVTDIGTVESVAGDDRLRRIRIRSAYDPASIALGASIACSGPCLTAVAVEGAEGGGCRFAVEAGAETLARTTAGSWRVGSRLNLERSLRIGDELGGHIVTGHVDGIAEILAREDVPGPEPGAASARFSVRAPPGLARFIAEKGSVTLDGVSLTVNEVMGEVFSIFLIPHTLAVTTWGERRPGDPVNLEVDLMARYAARLAEAGPAG